MGFRSVYGLRVAVRDQCLGFRIQGRDLLAAFRAHQFEPQFLEVQYKYRASKKRVWGGITWQKVWGDITRGRGFGEELLDQEGLGRIYLATSSTAPKRIGNGHE